MKNKPMNKKMNQREANLPTKKAQQQNLNKINNGVFVFTRSLTVGELAKELNINASDIIKKLFLQKKLVTINQYLDDETIGEICLEFGYDFKKEEIINEEDFEKAQIEDKEEDLQDRPPVVTVMGHVDHGKTTLIDAIRNSNLAANEVGGISQEIGAYQKVVNGKKITFIDTPGHEAFSAMRSRGASVTDIVVLVVAADDGVMPQTIEAIDHAKAAAVPIIVAINKIDVPGANPEKVLNELMQHDVIAEKFGGDVLTCEISAKKKLGINDLLEDILLQAEMLQLRANPKRYAIGTVLEAELDKGEGPKATLLVQNGTLYNNDYVVVGTTYGKIRRMTNEFKQIIKEVGPGTPCSVIGLSEVPLAGDRFMAFPTEKQAKEIAEKRKLKKVQEERAASNGVSSLDDLYSKIIQKKLETSEVSENDESTKHALNCIKKSNGAIAQLLSELRTIQPPALVELEAKPLLESVSAMVIPAAAEKNISVSLQNCDECKILADENKLINVLINVIYNSIDAIDKDGHIDIYTEITNDNMLKISIKDNGCGIEYKEFQNIFKEGYTTKPLGNGLGLYISKENMKELYGDLQLAASDKNGTTFAVLIPMV